MTTITGLQDKATPVTDRCTSWTHQSQLIRKFDTSPGYSTKPEHYDAQGRVKKHGKRRLHWRESNRSLATRRQHATYERKLAAQRKSVHGKVAHDIVRLGNQIQIEKTSFKGWQKLYGKSVGLRAPGMLIEQVRRIVAKTGGTLIEVPTYQTKLSQYCHGCQTYTKKALSERWHVCACGIGPVQRDVYSACLLAYLDPKELIPSIAHEAWEGAELRLRAAMERLQERANAGESFPQSMGLTRAGARRLKSLASPQQERVRLLDGHEALGEEQEPPLF